MGRQALRGAAAEGLANLTNDATVELTKKLSIPGGVGHIAYARGDDIRCMLSQSAYSIEFGDSRSGTFDTLVTLAYCDLQGRPDLYVDYVRELRLVTRAENRAAYGLD